MVISHKIKQNIEQIPKYVQKWENIARSTTPVDRDKVSRTLHLIQQHYSERPFCQPPIKHIIWAQSPIEAFMHLCDVFDTVGEYCRPLQDSSFYEMGGMFDLSKRGRSIFCDSSSFGCIICSRLYGSATAKTYCPTHGFLLELDNAIEYTIQNSILKGERLLDNREYVHGGNTDYWDAMYMDYAHNVCGLELGYENELYIQMAEAGFWCIADGFAIVSERPKTLIFDDQYALHNPDGLAIEYPDGWGFSAIHGRAILESISCDLFKTH